MPNKIPSTSNLPSQFHQSRFIAAIASAMMATVLIEEEGIGTQQQHGNNKIPLACLPCAVSPWKRTKSVAPNTPASHS
jgi:hypothetical protein